MSRVPLVAISAIFLGLASFSICFSAKYSSTEILTISLMSAGAATWVAIANTSLRAPAVKRRMVYSDIRILCFQHLKSTLSREAGRCGEQASDHDDLGARHSPPPGYPVLSGSGRHRA